MRNATPPEAKTSQSGTVCETASILCAAALASLILECSSLACLPVIQRIITTPHFEAALISPGGWEALASIVLGGDTSNFNVTVH